MHNKDKLWFDDQCRHDFGLMINAGMIFRVNWEEFVRCKVRANETFSEAKRQFMPETGLFS